MITVGIEGKPGSGKSTLSRYLNNDPSVIHIEVDPIVLILHLLPYRNIGFHFANRVVQRTFLGKGRYRYLNIQSDPIHIKIPTSKIFLAMTRFYYWILSRAIQRMLVHYEKEGFKIALVDYALLNVSAMWQKFDYRICVIKDENARVLSVKNRDRVDEKGVAFISLFSHFDAVKYGEGDVVCIYNNGSREELLRHGDALLNTLKSGI